MKNGTAHKPKNRLPAARSKAIPVVIPKPKMEYMEAKLVGLAPGLLINPFDQKAEAQLLGSMQKGKAKLTRPDKDPEADYEARELSTRVDDQENVHWIDVRAFKAAMCRGAKTVDKLSMTDFRSGVFVEQDSVINHKPVAHIHGTPIAYSCHVKNQGGKPDYRTRVLLPKWTYTLRFYVDTSVLSMHQALTCLVNAGRGVGVGDWRPEKNGVHGRWDVTECHSFDVVEA